MDGIEFIALLGLGFCFALAFGLWPSENEEFKGDD